MALDAADIYERLGSPEGELALAQAVVYLAVAAKSNAVYKAFNSVRAFIREDGTRPVPMYLRNAPTKLMDELGYGDGYRYAHDECICPKGSKACVGTNQPTADLKLRSAKNSRACVNSTNRRPSRERHGSVKPHGAKIFAYV